MPNLSCGVPGKIRPDFHVPVPMGGFSLGELTVPKSAELIILRRPADQAAGNFWRLHEIETLLEILGLICLYQSRKKRLTIYKEIQGTFDASSGNWDHHKVSLYK